MEGQTVTGSKRPVQRRSPNQARSRDKLELIYEASIRILNKHGLDGLTTNRIAEVAGISIGTLYQYFSNKQEILQALGKREVQATIARITEQFFAGDSEQDKLRLFIRILLNAFDGRHQVRRILLEIALTQGGLKGMEEPLRSITAFLKTPVAGMYFKNMAMVSDLDLFVLCSAMSGIVRCALVADQDLLDKRELEDRIMLLIRSYVDRLKTDAVN